jgi:hypothetical protein
MAEYFIKHGANLDSEQYRYIMLNVEHSKKLDAEKFILDHGILINP